MDVPESVAENIVVGDVPTEMADSEVPEDTDGPTTEMAESEVPETEAETDAPMAETEVDDVPTEVEAEIIEDVMEGNMDVPESVAANLVVGDVPTEMADSEVPEEMTE